MRKQKEILKRKRGNINHSDYNLPMSEQRTISTLDDGRKNEDNEGEGEDEDDEDEDSEDDEEDDADLFLVSNWRSKRI